MSRVLLVFLDGVGIGPRDPDVNPFMQAELPAFTSLLGGIPTLDEPGISRVSGAHTASTFPLDARMGVDGLPQSGTGQTSLFTGLNAAREYGRHFGPWVPVALRPLLAERSILRAAAEAGRSVAFANAYPAGWMESRGERRPAAPPLVAHAAGALTRTARELAAGDAVASEIIHDGWRRFLDATLPEVTAAKAGANLAAIAEGHDLTLFAHYNTDTQGHRGGMAGAVESLERVDAFLAGLLGGLSTGTTLLIVSDHGNVEDVREGHTLNPALGLVAGPASSVLVQTELLDLTAVTPGVLAHLGIRRD